MHKITLINVISAIAAILATSALALAFPNQAFAQTSSNTGLAGQIGRMLSAGQAQAGGILSGQVLVQQAGQELPQQAGQKAGQVLGLTETQAGKVFCFGEGHSVLGNVLVGQDHVSHVGQDHLPHVGQVLAWQDHESEHHNIREIVR